jgi:glycosyltransferase involved in cell wall biosynthesis
VIDRVFVLIPAYNAGATLERVLARIPDAARLRLERLVIVDDGSLDDTALVLARLKARLPQLVVLRHDHNRGYGAAEKTLLDYALREGAGATVLLHADGQYSPQKILDMLEPLDRGEADLVQGSRMVGGGALRGGMPLYKFAANRVLTGVQNIAFGMRLAEYHSGYLAHSARLLERLPLDRLSDSFDIDIEVMICAHLLGLRIREVAIPTIYAGEISYLRPVRYGLDVLKIVKKYRRGFYRALLQGEA